MSTDSAGSGPLRRAGSGSSKQVNEVEKTRALERKEVTQEDFQTAIVKHLIRRGLVVERQGLPPVVDVEAFKEASLSSLGLRANTKGQLPVEQLRHLEPLLDRGLYQVLTDVFANRPVVSKKDLAQALHDGREAVAKPLLYRPTSVADALDPESIRKAEAQLFPWEMRAVRRDGKEAIQYKDGSLGLDELTVAAMVYHPSCGAGIRDTSGALFVKDPKDEHRVKISGEWFMQNRMWKGGTDLGESSFHAPQRWLAAHPALEQHNVLLTKDFTKQSRHHDGEAGQTGHARYVERHGTTSQGNVTFNGIVHHLGKEYKGRADLFTVNVRPNLGLCSERDATGALKPLFTFRIFQPTDPEIIALRKEGRFAQVGLGAIKKKPLSEEVLTVSSEQADESVKAVLEYLHFHAKDVDQARVDRALRLSPATLFALTSWLEGMRDVTRSVFQELIDQHGETAAKFLLLFREQEKTDVFTFCKRSKDLGVPATRAIMQRCIALQEAGEQSSAAIVDELFAGPSVPERLLDQELKGEIARRWKRILAQISGEKRISFEQLSTRLDGLKKENALFASVFRVAFKGKTADEAFALMRHMTFDAAVLPREIDPRTKKEMIEIFDANWVDQDQTAAKVFKGGLEARLAKTDDTTKFYLLKKDGEVMAFIRFDDRPDLGPHAVYGGSLNVHPAFRQSGIGEVMMQKTIEQVAKERVIHAHVVPDAVVGTAYVEQMKCVITGIDQVHDEVSGKDGALLCLRRDDTRSYHMHRTAASWEALRAGSVPGVEVKRFDLQTEKAAFLQTVKQMAAQGRVITRYSADKAHPTVRWIAIEQDVAPTPSSQAPIER